MKKIRTYNEYCNLEFILSPRHRQFYEDESMDSEDAYERLVQLGDDSILVDYEDCEENADYE